MDIVAVKSVILLKFNANNGRTFTNIKVNFIRKSTFRFLLMYSQEPHINI